MRSDCFQLNHLDINTYLMLVMLRGAYVDCGYITSSTVHINDITRYIDDHIHTDTI